MDLSTFIFGTIIYQFAHIKIKFNSKEPGQNVQRMCYLAWLYTGGNYQFQFQHGNG